MILEKNIFVNWEHVPFWGIWNFTSLEKVSVGDDIKSSVMFKSDIYQPELPRRMLGKPPKLSRKHRG